MQYLLIFMTFVTAPLTQTIDHFWRMVWECNVEAIVMLTKCVEMNRVSWNESNSALFTLKNHRRKVQSTGLTHQMRPLLLEGG